MQGYINIISVRTSVRLDAIVISRLALMNLIVFNFLNFLYIIYLVYKYSISTTYIFVVKEQNNHAFFS